MRRVVLTRPALQASSWHAQLLAADWQVISLPLIDIAASSDTQPLLDAQQRLAGYDAIMFVSSSAVWHFFNENQGVARINIAHNAINTIAINAIRCWVTGPGTAAALRAHAVAEGLVDAPSDTFDSESLWRQVASQIQVGRRVLIVRGIDVGSASASRDWLADQIRAAGGQADVLAIYERRAPTWNAEQLQWAATSARDGSIWLLSSSQAIRHLPPNNYSQARALCTHPRIVQAACAAGFGVVHSTQPLLPEVLRGLESLNV